METLLLKVEPDRKDFLLTLLHEFNFVEIISENYQQDEEIDVFDELDAHQQAVLMQAIDESENEENLIPHEDVMKMYRQ
jgi:Mg/Co/Ni transporter MgtE